MTTEQEFQLRGLGTYMRYAGRILRADSPTTATDAHARTVTSGSIDVPYMMAVLLRLEVRGIAKRVLVTMGGEYDLGFIRGPNWSAAAHMYKWPGNGDLPPVAPTDTLKDVMEG